MKRLTAGLLLGLLISWTLRAIPAFARKYGFSCAVCHAPFPHLKEFGEEFAERGFTIENEPKRATKKTGDPLLLLQRDLPIALRMDLYLVKEGEGTNLDLKAPYVLKFLSGGNISKNISYYMYFLLTEEGKIAGLEDAYIALNNLFGLPVALIFGQFRVSDPVKPSELRLTFENYRIYKFKVGLSKVALSYERGLMLLYSTPFGTNMSFEIVNGNGLEKGVFDSDSHKNLVARIAQQAGPATAGFMVYWGKEGEETVNELSYIGPDLSLRLGKLQLFLQYLRRKDSNPLFLQSPRSYITKALLAELLYSPQGEDGRWFLTLLYNFIDSEYDPADYHTLSINVNYLIRRNLKWITELTMGIDSKEQNRFVTGLITAF